MKDFAGKGIVVNGVRFRRKFGGRECPYVRRAIRHYGSPAKAMPFLNLYGIRSMAQVQAAKKDSDA